MALENKKSILQPSSVEAQRYRLQYSNVESQANQTITSAGAIAPTQRAATSTANVSQFAPVPVPAPVVAPPTPTPPAAVEIPVEYKQALYFDGTTYVSASIDGLNDLDWSADNNEYLTFTLIFKPDNIGLSPRQTIFHMYSGSADTQSLELYLQHGSLVCELRPDSDPANIYSFKSNLPSVKQSGRAFNMPNSYTFYQFRLKNTFRDIKFAAYTTAGNSSWNTTTSTLVKPHASFDLSNSTNLHIGGTVNGFFSGSIAAVMITNGPEVMPNQTWGDMALREKDPSTVDPQLRTYSFDGALTETTGSQASASLPLELVTGTLTYVDGYVKR